MWKAFPLMDGHDLAGAKECCVQRDPVVVSSWCSEIFSMGMHDTTSNVITEKHYKSNSIILQFWRLALHNALSWDIISFQIMAEVQCWNYDSYINLARKALTWTLRRIMSNQILNNITFTKWSSVFCLTFFAFTKGVTWNVYVSYEIPLLSPATPILKP